MLTRPWEAAEVLASYDRLSYLVALLAPLAFLSLAAPLLAAGALPEVLINALSDWFPQYSIEFQYVAVIVPFLVAAAILGLARLRARATRLVGHLLERDGAVAAAWVGVVLLSGVYLGPLPWWSGVPVAGSDERIEQYRVEAHAQAAARAVALIPGDAPVSAGNLLGAHLSQRCAHPDLPGARRCRVGGGRPPPPLPPRPPGAGGARPRSRGCRPGRTCGSSSRRTASCSSAASPGARVIGRASGGR